MKNKISIVTICYNCKDDLEMTIKSVISQTYSNIEYVVIDGGSTDGTLDVVEKYKEHFAFCVSEKDDGIYDALNKGVQHCTGDWILCLNAGDILYDDKVLSDILEKDIPDKISFLYSDLEVYGVDGKKLIFETNRQKGNLHHQNAIYRRSLHERYGYYIVTHPYIISDLLFFLAVPQEQFLKIGRLISKVKYGGISCQGHWVEKQASAAKVIYGYETIPHIFYLYMRICFYEWRKEVKNKIRKMLGLTK